MRLSYLCLCKSPSRESSVSKCATGIITVVGVFKGKEREGERERKREKQISSQEYISMNEIVIAAEKPRKINVPQTVMLHLGP